jgi:hypothetical protein
LRKNLRVDAFCRSDLCFLTHSIAHLFDDEEVADAFRESVAACCDGRLRDPTILALQPVGGSMGSMIAIHNMVAVCSVLGMENQEGKILKRTAGPMLVYGVIAAAMALLLM